MTNKLISTYTPSSNNRHRWQTYDIMPPWHTHERKLMDNIIASFENKIVTSHTTPQHDTTIESKSSYALISTNNICDMYIIERSTRHDWFHRKHTPSHNQHHIRTHHHTTTFIIESTRWNSAKLTKEDERKQNGKVQRQKGCLYTSQHTINTSCTFTHGQHITHTHDHIHPTSMIADNERIHQHRKRDAKSKIESTPSNKHTSLQATQVIIWTQQEHVLWFNRTWTRWYQISTKSSKRPAICPNLEISSEIWAWGDVLESKRWSKQTASNAEHSRN